MPACTNAGVHACKCARVYACILLVCIYASWLCVCSMHLLEVALRSMVATHHSIDSIYTVQAVDATQHMRVHEPVVGKHGVRAAPRAHLRHVIHPFPSPLALDISHYISALCTLHTVTCAQRCIVEVPPLVCRQLVVRLPCDPNGILKGNARLQRVAVRVLQHAVSLLVKRSLLVV
jgi:hypothetical protein